MQVNNATIVCNHTRFRSILTQAGVTQSTIFPPCTWNNRHVQWWHVCNFSQQSWLTTQLLSKRMVVSYAFVAPTVIVDVPYEQASRTLLEIANVACPTSTIDAVHYKPTEDGKRKWPDIRSESQWNASVLPRTAKTKLIYLRRIQSIAVGFHLAHAVLLHVTWTSRFNEHHQTQDQTATNSNLIHSTP